MTRRKAFVVSVIALSGCIVLIASVTVRYTIRNSANGDLLWHDQDAYLFLEVSSLGYRSSYLGYFVEAITAFFNVPIPATNRASNTIVFRFTPEGLERYDGGSLVLGPEIAPLDDIIYADSDRGLVKWSGRQFEPTNGEEHRRFVTRSTTGPDFVNPNGWSRRSFIFNKGVDAKIFDEGGDVNFEFQLDGKGQILTITHGEGSSYFAASWEHQVQGAQKFWYLGLRPHKVTKSEYELAFGK
jgi:hypothetical protein